MAAINDIALYLVQTVINLYLLAVLLRLVLQWVRADFYNPICQFLVKITAPVISPLRKIIPPLGKLDTATLVVALLLQALGICLILVLSGYGLPAILQLLIWSALGLVGLLVNFYFFAILGMIILSWVAQGAQNPALTLLYQVTEPVMAPFRRLLPPLGGLDLSPILVFILINIVQIALRHIAAGVGLHPALVMGI